MAQRRIDTAGQAARRRQRLRLHAAERVLDEAAPLPTRPLPVSPLLVEVYRWRPSDADLARRASQSSRRDSVVPFSPPPRGDAAA